MATKKTTKTVDLKETIAKTEADINAARLAKITKLADAKKEHDAAVQQAKEDELAEYRTQLEEFSKRVPFLCSLAKQLAVVMTVPTVMVNLARKCQYSYVFGVFQYKTDSREPKHWCVGCKSNGHDNHYVIDESGVWLDYKVRNKDIYATELSDKVVPDSFSGPNAKEFMLAAVEWEKKLLETVDLL